MSFLDRLLGRSEPSSRDIAKERLQLVLVHDRTKISPALLDKMKDELIILRKSANEKLLAGFKPEEQVLLKRFLRDLM